MFRRKPKINPREQQREKLLELGSRLQQIRTEREIPLDRVARQTLIPRRLLQAIEAGDLDALPEPIYIRWLIKQFAEALELDGVEFASTFPTDRELKSESRFSARWLPSLQLRPIHLYFLYILLVMASVKGISNVLEESAFQVNRLPTPLIENEQPSLTTDPKPSPQAHPITTTEPSQASNKPVIVDIQLKDESWLKVVVDGKTEFEGVLPQGTHRTWEADKELTVRAGNAGGVFVVVNKKEAKQLGRLGQVEEVTYTAN